VPMKDEITTHYKPGSSQEVTLHDGSVVRLQKLDEDYDPHDRRAALDKLKESQEQGKELTGLLYLDPDSKELHELLGTTQRPLRSLTEEDLCPGVNVLEKINLSFQ